MSSGRASPFSPRTALIMVLVGALGFAALLWSIGSGMADPEPQPSGAHISGKGLTGYAALGAYLTARGYTVSASQSRGALRQPGLLILTPLHNAKPDDLESVIKAHRMVGPTILIMPKWLANELPKVPPNPKVRKGFVALLDARPPQWPGFHDELSVALEPLGEAAGAGEWHGLGLNGQMADPAQVVSGSGKWLVPLIRAGNNARIVAGYLSDGGYYPALRELASEPEPEFDDNAATAAAASQPTDDGSVASSDAAGRAGIPITVDLPPTTFAKPVDYSDAYPLIIVFDPDLLNNYGLARQENAVLAEALFGAALDGADKNAVFDLALAGYGRSQNLLQLAFTPPFLAATLCLLLAAMVALWRAYNRFGPPLLTSRSIAFGKRALVANAAGLLRRARRLHLVGAPYADAARERLAKALALPLRLDPMATEAAIDRALAARAPHEPPFSSVTADLRSARKPRDLLRAAQRLHALERILLR